MRFPAQFWQLVFDTRHGGRPLAGRFTGCSWSAADVRRDPAGNLLCHAIPGDCHWRTGFWSGPYPPSLEQASRLLGENGAGTFARVHFPLLRPALVSSALLVFADAMKELPTTLLLRPVNFETLATLLYAEAARGTYEEGAIAALMIVLAGTLPVILLVRHQMTRRG